MSDDIIQEIEQQFLGATIRSDEAFKKSRRLSLSDFSVPVHGEIYTSIVSRYENGGTITAHLLAIEFSKHPELSHLGGGRYIIDIANSLLSTINAPEYAEQIYEAAAARQNPEINEVEMICMNEIKMEKINWLWPDRIACGKLTVIAGNPGLGKSQVTASLAAIVSKGMGWPDTEAPAQQGDVIFLSAEDDASDTIKPRLLAAGAEISRCHILTAIKEEGKVRSFVLTQDIDRLAIAIKRTHARVVIIDPISAYLGGTDSHRDADMRGLLAPLAAMAAKYNVAIVLIAHFNKSDKQEPTARVNGSIGLIAAARAGYAVIKDKNNPEIRYFLPIKNNIGNDTEGLSFQIEGRTLEGGIETSRVRWSADLFDAHKILHPEPEEQPTATNGAADFLREILSKEPMPANDVLAEAKGAGHSEAAVQRAAGKINVRRKKGGMTGGWMWSLPTSAAEDSEDDPS